jgi:hypothetical protein
MWSTQGPGTERRPGPLTSTAFSVSGPTGWSVGKFPRVFTPTAAYGISRGRALAIGLGYETSEFDGSVPRRIETWSTESALTGAGARWRRTILWKGPVAVTPVVATNARGDTVVMWAGRLGSRKLAIFAARKRAGHRFSRVRRLSLDRVSAGSAYIATAINGRGDAVFAWDRGKAAYARTLSRRNRLGRTLRVGRGKWPKVVGTSIGARGEISVVWSPDIGTPLLHSRAARGRRFGRPFVLDLCPENCLDATAATGRDGELFVAWQTRDQGGVIPRATALRPGARTLQEFGREYQDTYSPMSPIADRSGRAAILKSSHYSVVPQELRLAVAEPGGAFGPFERVPTNGDLSVVATDPVTGRISVLYAPRPVPPDYRAQPLQVVERR